VLRDANKRTDSRLGPIELLTLPEAADALRLSRRTLQRLISTGELPTVRIGHRTLIRAEDLRSLVARSRAWRCK